METNDALTCDHEADVIIVGYGGAGAAAAIVASDAGAKVIIVEKSPEGGGNTRYSGGSIRTYLELNKVVDFFETICEGTTERDVVVAFVNESAKNSEWLATLGAETVVAGETSEGFPIRLPGAAFPHIRGAEAIGPRVHVKGSKKGGRNLWEVLSHSVAEKKIPILYSTAVEHISFEKSQGVTGVIARAAGKKINIRAMRAVILSCGGYEYDSSMHLNYLGQSFLSLGHPGNTGDGVRLAAELGADLWHMSAVAATFGYKVPDFEFGIRHRMRYAGYVYVDQFGKRFMDETGVDGHAMWAPASYIDMKTLQKPRVPSYLVFDETTRLKGPIGWTSSGRVSDIYQWSADNSLEVKKGWVKASETIVALAARVEINPESLDATIAHYNLSCKQGYDLEFGRAPTTLLPIVKSPFYAIALWPSIINTQGGPKRNARAQVLDVWGHPIKRLYSAGELGSMWHRNYPGGGNVSEALAFGRISGMHAASEKPVS
jgi:succinate dehydrogenase/fumarate reductase flavoprotein subunit